VEHKENSVTPVNMVKTSDSVCRDTSHINNIHASIFYTRLILLSGRGGAGDYPNGLRARGGVHPGQVILTT